MTATPVAAAEGVSIRFAARASAFGRRVVVPAVEDASLVVGVGETLGIVGESGCGKTTLARAVVALVRPAAGRILWDGRDVATMGPAQLRSERRHVQFVFQDPFASFDPRLPVGASIAAPLEAFEPGLSAAGRRDRVREAALAVGLPEETLARFPHEFSGGQCQRLAIARALVGRPRLVVCDEPVSALDVSIQAQIVNLLAGLRGELGLSLLFISHNLAVVRRLSRRIMVMYLGRVVEVAGREEFFRQPLHPYSRALIAAVPGAVRAGRSAPAALGELPSPLDPPSGCAFRTRCPKAAPLCAEVRPPLADHGGRLAACHFPG
jgi:oligopeptide transport system ATP-binding protein